MRSDHLTLDSTAFGVAAGTVAAVLFTLCALAVAVAPAATAASFSTMLHIDLTGIARPITLGGYIAGVICVTLAVGLSFGAGAAFYNRIVHGAPATARSETAARRPA